MFSYLQVICLFARVVDTRPISSYLDIWLRHEQRCQISSLKKSILYSWKASPTRKSELQAIHLHRQTNCWSYSVGCCPFVCSRNVLVPPPEALCFDRASFHVLWTRPLFPHILQCESNTQVIKAIGDAYTLPRTYLEYCQAYATKMPSTPALTSILLLIV